jgi:ABC-type polysaccharide/polyol phosphate export permease
MAEVPTAAAVDRQRRPREDEFTSERHLYEPHPIGLPPLGPYFRALWKRRQFAFALARSNLRAEHFNTVLGQVWLVLNPVLFALVYFTLVEIVRGGSRSIEFLAHLMICLFAFRFVSRSVGQGTGSVVGGGRLILNTAFPRTVLPLTSVMTSFMTFLPTLLVYAVVHAIAGLPVGLHLLWTVPIFATLAVFATGATMLTATAQVYFRDLANFLRYATRIWLYTSPILFYTDEVPERLKPILQLNPLWPMLGALSDVVNLGQTPSAEFLLWGFAWAVAVLFAGAFVFISREREFAVRL